MQPRPTTPQAADVAPPVADLCATCRHEDNCNLCEMPTAPVHECNEYDDGTAVAPRESVVLQSVPVTAKASATSALVGLCVNCDHRETCTLPRPAGGVWHCEEYR